LIFIKQILTPEVYVDKKLELTIKAALKNDLSIEKSYISEGIGDNNIDNMVDELRSATEKEIQMFVSMMLSRVIRQFAQSYSTPHFEEFRKVLEDIVTRFNVMDSSEKGDLFTKIENMFKDIFVKNYSDLGPDAAKTVGSLYAAQMVRYLKSQQVQSNKNMFTPKSIM
jgi:hypothetical protein